ncbi:MAG TPA: ABC transporter substrate-binding protein [Candidatus Binataceae bacterium]|jgi:branched-chain amino acid transport system substrate-binding protein
MNWTGWALRLLTGAALLGGSFALTANAIAQNEQFVPGLVYRTGAYAPNGVPFANGRADYFALLNARDGGINGVKIVYEECETGYATDRGVECYERLKGKGPTGAAAFSPLSTGITFALTEKAPGDKIPLLTQAYGRADSIVGNVFAWNFPLTGTYWDAADILVQYIAKGVGGTANLKGKRLALVYHDSPYGKEPIAVLEDLSKRYGFTFDAMPVTHPGVEQKSTWLQIRQNKPDWVFLWGWGVMNSAAIKEAVAVNYPRDHMFGVWWSGAEPDVTPAGDGAKGYYALALHPVGQIAPVHQEIVKHIYDKNLGTGKKEEVGEVLYNRGLIDGMLVAEAIRTAMTKYGNKPMTGEQVRWGFENLDLTSARLQQIGFGGLAQPLKVSCEDHAGVHQARLQQWDGKKWNFVSDVIVADQSWLRPKAAESATAYAKQKNLTPGCAS